MVCKADLPPFSKLGIDRMNAEGAKSREAGTTAVAWVLLDWPDDAMA